MDELTRTFVPQGIRVFDPIHHSTAFDKAVGEGRSTLELWPQTPGVRNYQAIVDEPLAYVA